MSEICLTNYAILEGIYKTVTAEIQIGRSFLSDLMLDLKICRRGARYAKQQVFPVDKVVPVILLNLDKIPKIQVRINDTALIEKLQKLEQKLGKVCKIPVSKVPCLNEVVIYK